MRRIIATTEIAASPEAVWAFADDASRYPEYVEFTDRVLDMTEGPLRTGYAYREYGGVPPFKSESGWTVTAYEPHTRQVHVGDDGMVRSTLEILLEARASGTRLTLAIALEPRWYMALPMAVMWPLMLGRRTQAGLDRTADNMKRLVEAEAVPAGHT